MSRRSHRTVWLVRLRVRPAERLEEWFEAQALDGWVAERLGWLSAIALRLERDDRRPHYRYVIDRRTFPDAQQDQRIESHDWEDVGTISGRDVWRKEYDGAQRPAWIGE